MTPRTDDLTRLPLRSAFLEAASAAIERARRSSLPVSLLVIDVDYFKQVNDTYGHLQGDDVLVGVAELLRRTLRAADVPARYAGDEFVALLSDTGATGARDVAERICAAVRGHVFPLRDRPGAVPMTVSVGVASFPDDGDSSDALFAAADRALYQVKRAGRDGVASASAAADLPPAAATPRVERFVGRGAELRALGRYVEEAASGHPRLVLVAGEAGVGKTTLVQQLEPDLRLRAGLLARGRCVEADVRPPYAPWGDIVGAIHRRHPVEPPRPWRQLPRVVPALAGGGDEPLDRYALFEEIALYLRLASASRPIAIALDDAQWATPETWDALEFVVDALDAERLIVLLTVRSEELRGEALVRRQRLSRNPLFREVAVGRLGREELRRWAEAVFHRQDVGHEFLHYLFARTEGNPLLTVQMLRALIDSGAMRFTGERWEWERTAELPIPTPVVDLVERRLGQLPPESRRTLAGVAILGRDFDIELAVDAEVAPEAALLTAVEDGVRAGVIGVSVQGGVDRYAFTHALFAELLVQGMVPRRRRAAHERAAQTLLRRAPGAAAAIARHFDEAADSPNAYAYALQAAAQARVVYAHDEAERFLLVAERHAGTAAELAEVRARRGELAEAVGRYADAEQLLELAAGWFAGQGDRLRALPLRRRVERVRALLGRPARETIERARALLAEAEQLGLARERVVLLDLLSEAHARAGDHAAAEREAWAAVHATGSVGDATLRADALDRLAVTVARVHPEQGSDIHRQALALYELTGDAPGEATALAHLGIAELRRGRWQEAQQAIERAVQITSAAAAPDLRGYLALCLGTVNLHRGDFDRARALLTEAMQLFAAVRSGDLQLDALLALAFLERERGEPAASAELYDAAATFARRLGNLEGEVAAVAGAGLARLLLGQPEAAAAASTAADLLALSRADWFAGREVADALAVRVAAARGDLANAWRRFEVAAAAAAPSDRYGAAWLTAECAEALLPYDADGVRAAAGRYVAPLGDFGAGAVRARYEALLGDSR